MRRWIPFFSVGIVAISPGEGGQSASFDTNTVLWRFFSEHPLAAVP